MTRFWFTQRHKDHKATLQRSLRALRALVFVSLLIVSTMWLSGCVRLSDSKPPGPWHEAYVPIVDPASEAFITRALERAVADYGEPLIPVNKVLLRRSRKAPAAERYRIDEDFSLTECVDVTNGLFVIYLAVDPGHQNYFPLLGHECAHLLSPRIFDWYMEGFASVFSAQICEETGYEWGDWKRHFERTRRGPYGLSYRMMRELQEEFPVAYSRIIRFTTESADDTARQHIDIDAWLATLPPERRLAALDIISSYAESLYNRRSDQYHFVRPHAK